MSRLSRNPRQKRRLHHLFGEPLLCGGPSGLFAVGGSPTLEDPPRRTRPAGFIVKAGHTRADSDVYLGTRGGKLMAGQNLSDRLGNLRPSVSGWLYRIGVIKVWFA